MTHLGRIVHSQMNIAAPPTLARSPDGSTSGRAPAGDASAPAILGVPEPKE